MWSFAFGDVVELIGAMLLGAFSATLTGLVVELARAFRDPARRPVRGITVRQNLKRALS